MKPGDVYEGSPFVIGNIVKDPSMFWGRRREYTHISTRLRKMESSSIVGPRRIGKSSLAYYVYNMGPGQLGSQYELVWLDSQSNYVASFDHFCRAVAKHSSLNYESDTDITQCLMNFEDAVKQHDKELVIIINEFEILTSQDHQAQFGRSFYNTLRLLAEQSYCALVTTSNTSLRSLCAHILGVSSPFYNIFDEIPLQHFTAEEAKGFLHDKRDQGILTESEIEFIQQKVPEYQHPLVLQIACDSVFQHRQDNLEDLQLLAEVEKRVGHFLTHEEVRKGRRMAEQHKKDSESSNRGDKSTDLLVSVLVPVLGIGILMLEYGLLIRTLGTFQAVLLALVSTILGFAVLIFAGRSIGIIGESTFYKVFLRLVDQIPLLSNLANSIIKLADRLKK